MNICTCKSFGDGIYTEQKSRDTNSRTGRCHEASLGKFSSQVSTLDINSFFLLTEKMKLIITSALKQGGQGLCVHFLKYRLYTKLKKKS